MMWNPWLLLASCPTSALRAPAPRRISRAPTFRAETTRSVFAFSFAREGSSPRQRRRSRPGTTTALRLSVEEVVQELANEASAELANPAEEAALSSDVGRVFSDLVVLFEPETVLLRLSVVVGRLFQILSEYFQDQMIRGDQLAFDVPLLGASLFLFWRSAEPIIQATSTELSELDCDAFEQCFAPVGVSLLQFKSMKAVGCLEWITCVPETVLVDEHHFVEDMSDWQYLYWQYEGVVIRSFRGNVFSTVERTDGKNIDDPDASGLLGTTRFLYKLEEQETLERQRKASNGKRAWAKDGVEENAAVSPIRYPIATITIGSKGATLLRIDSFKLFDLMERDAKLESSIRKLLVKSLQRKIGNLLYAQEKAVVERRDQGSHED